MAYTARTHDEIVTDLISKVQAKNIGISNFSEGSVIRALIDVFADEIQNTEEYIENLYGCLTIFGMGTEELDGVGQMLGITRNVGVKPTATVRFSTGDSPTTERITIPKDYEIEAEIDSETYTFLVATTSYIEIGESYKDVPVIGEEAKRVNIPPYSITGLTDSLNGVFECYNVNTVISGADAETDEEFIETIRSSQYGACSESYIKSSLLRVPFIDGVTIIDDEVDNGTYHIYFRLSGRYSTYLQLPNASDVTSILEYTRPAGGTYKLHYATSDDEIITVDTNFLSLSTEQQEGIHGVIREYLNGIDIGGTVSISQITARVISYLLQFDKSASANVYIAGSSADYELDTGKYFDIDDCVVEIDGVTVTV